MEAAHAGIAIAVIEHGTPCHGPFAKPIDLSAFAVT